MTDPTAQQMAALCARAYNDPPTYGTTDSAGRAHNYDGVIVFRGTDNPASMLADIDILTTPTPGLGTLHAGFWQAWLPLEAQLLALSPQVIAGHSEGGALAVIYAGMLCLAGKPPSAVYCFEPPRLCVDGTLKAILDKAGVMILATCNAIDPIPWVPPEMSFPGEYAHIGRVYLDDLNPIDYHFIDSGKTSVEKALA